MKLFFKTIAVVLKQFIESLFFLRERNRTDWTYISFCKVAPQFSILTIDFKKFPCMPHHDAGERGCREQWLFQVLDICVLRLFMVQFLKYLLVFSVITPYLYKNTTYIQFFRFSALIYCQSYRYLQSQTSDNHGIVSRSLSFALYFSVVLFACFYNNVYLCGKL